MLAKFRKGELVLLDLARLSYVTFGPDEQCGDPDAALQSVIVKIIIPEIDVDPKDGCPVFDRKYNFYSAKTIEVVQEEMHETHRVQTFHSIPFEHAEEFLQRIN